MGIKAKLSNAQIWVKISIKFYENVFRFNGTTYGTILQLNAIHNLSCCWNIVIENSNTHVWSTAALPASVFRSRLMHFKFTFSYSSWCCCCRWHFWSMLHLAPSVVEIRWHKVIVFLIFSSAQRSATVGSKTKNKSKSLQLMYFYYFCALHLKCSCARCFQQCLSRCLRCRLSLKCYYNTSIVFTYFFYFWLWHSPTRPLSHSLSPSPCLSFIIFSFSCGLINDILKLWRTLKLAENRNVIWFLVLVAGDWLCIGMWSNTHTQSHTHSWVNWKSRLAKTLLLNYN